MGIWGEGEGLREWAGENGLGVVGEFFFFGGFVWMGLWSVMLIGMCLGANFVYAQHKKQ